MQVQLLRFKRHIVCLLFFSALGNNIVLARNLDSANKFFGRAGIRVSAAPWTVGDSGHSKTTETTKVTKTGDTTVVTTTIQSTLKSDKQQKSSHLSSSLEITPEILQKLHPDKITDDKFIFYLPRQEALLTVTYNYFVLEPVDADDDPDSGAIAVSGEPSDIAESVLEGIGFSQDDMKNSFDAIKQALTVKLTQLKSNPEKTDAKTIVETVLSKITFSAPTARDAVEKQMIANLQVVLPNDTGGDPNNVKPPTGLIVPLELDKMTAFLSIDKPVNFQLIAVPDNSLGFVADYEHAQPATSDLKQGLLNINDKGIITGVNSQTTDELPAITTDVAISAIDIAKAIATFGASGLIPKTSVKTPNRTPQSENLHAKKHPTKAKLTSILEITVQKNVNTLNGDALIEQPINLTEQVSAFLTQKHLPPVPTVPQLVLRVSAPSTSGTFAKPNYCTTTSAELLAGKYLNGIIVRQPEVVHFTVLDETKQRIFYDAYAQLAQTGSLTAISLRQKTARDSTKNITLTDAGGVKSVEENTTSPVKAWTAVLKAIAGAL